MAITTRHVPAPAQVTLAGLTGRLQGYPHDASPPLVLLHGLTFDRRLWDPVMDALPEGRRALALDLPGHGGSAPPAGRGMAPAAEALAAAIGAAGLERPVIVGHSVGGPLAMILAAEGPAAGVVSIEAPIRAEAFAGPMREMGPALAGDGFARAWGMMADSLGMDRVPAEHRALVAPGRSARQEVVLAYQADLLERPLAEVMAWRDAGLASIRDAGTPVLHVHSQPQDPADLAWLADRLPGARALVWHARHHFPQLEDPASFAALIGAVGRPR